MKTSILICEPDEGWAKELKEFLESHQYKVVHVTNGKDCQSAVYENDKFGAVILQHLMESHSSISVLKYLKFNSPSSRIIYTVDKLEDLQEIGIGKGDLRNLGCYDVVEKPLKKENILKLIELYNNPKLWSSIEKSEKNHDVEDVNESDDSFEKVLASSFYSGNTTIFSIYIRLGQDKYIKVLHKGDAFDKERLDKYINEKNVEHFYFKKEDRLIYINYMNNLVSKIVTNEKVSTEVKSSMTKTMAEKYISQAYTDGLNPRVVEEGKKLCDNIYNFIKTQDKLKSVIDDFFEQLPEGVDHSFLVSFFTLTIAKNVDWATDKSTKILGMGALLHDIGKTQFPPELKDKRFEELEEPEQIEIYKKHPANGKEILAEYPFLESGVLDIVGQHHEKLDGSGYPLGLTGMKIYPLAKIVALANGFVNEMVSRGLSPTETLQEFVRDPKMLVEYDNNLVRALMKSFVSLEGLKKHKLAS